MAGTKTTTKKRTAPSQTGPSAKRAHLTKSTKVTTTVDKKRSRPITRPAKTDSESEEASDEAEEEGEIFKEQDGDEEVPMDVDENAAPLNQTPKDPNGRLNIF